MIENNAYEVYNQHTSKGSYMHTHIVSNILFSVNTKITGLFPN